MSSLLSADLAAACNALGYYDAKSGKYYADANTLETVKDLIRYLRRDDETHDIRRQLGETAVLQSDLLPLLKSYWEEADLFDVLLRLVVNLTTPALLLWNEQRPTEKTASNYYLQVEGHLQSYKEAFADETVWAVLSKRLSKILELEPLQRGDENSLIIERILILIRNILYIPADSMERRPDNDASIHDQVLWAFHQSGMLDIILYITSSQNESAYYLHILEILSYMLREQKASDLAHAALQRSQTEKVRDEAELLAIRHKEINEKQKKSKAYSGTRHSRFGGTFVVKSMKSISENELIYYKPLSKLESLDFDTDKVKPKTPRNRLPVKATSTERRSAFSIRLFLKEFCVEFLNGAYNTLMYHVKDNLVRAKSQANDESYYLWAIRFFMEFNRCYKFEVKLVSETMSVQTFHYVQQQSENFYDMMATDKKKIKLWSRRLHLAVLAYRELFMTLAAMDRSPDGNVRDSAKVIKSNIFYVLEYREFILTLLVNYDELKMSDTYLKDLIETQHIFIKMLETFIGREGSVMVQGKSRKKKGTTKKGSKKSSQPISLTFNLDAMWDETSPQVSAILESNTQLSTDIAPFDAASDIPIDDQKVDAMKNIQRKLRNGEFETAIAILRAAREIWPENDSFGSPNMAPEEEFLALRDIFFADLGENTKEAQPNESDDVSDNENEEDEEDREQETYQECDFKFNDFIKRLCHPRIVRAASLALKEFNVNSTHTNHCVAKLLHRIAFDSKMSVMVCQLSIFRTFQHIFEVQDVPEYKELVKFATYIIRQFVKIADINKKVFMEMLFWKSSKECFDIEYGYSETHGKDAANKAWSEQQEDEVRRLFMEHQSSGNTDDVVDFITENLIEQTKSRRQVLKKLKELMLLVDYKGKKKSGSRPPKNWTTEEEETLQELFEQFKNTDDPLGNIMNSLITPRPKNRVVEKLLVMGLIQDKKEIQKKRSGYWRKSHQHSSEENISSSDEDVSKPTKPSGILQKPLKKKKIASSNSKENQRPKFVQVARSKIIQLLIAVKNNEMQEPLQWLRESLGDAIDDYEVGNSEGIPLVPVMDYAEAAMENVEFQRLLKAFGVCPPFDEQEIYWRIPVALKPDTLQEYCNMIDQALDDNLQVTVGELKADIQLDYSLTNMESSDDDNVFNKLRIMVKDNSEENNKNIRSEKSPSIESNASDINSDEESNTNKNRSNSDKSNDGEIFAEINVMNQEENFEENLKGKRQRALLDSDDENQAPVSKRSRIIIESDSE
ncbi:protein timeless homolog [Anthonomus grandis grandis]|uniref:protein timeless homolog n=1 Tax=Anthonomus grandis grandis TaxID=2921223 RepID=UPI0021669C7D|nr:protein timeless homolog [Anthonomus grandis grandis]